MDPITTAAIAGLGMVLSSIITALVGAWWNRNRPQSDEGIAMQNIAQGTTILLGPLNARLEFLEKQEKIQEMKIQAQEQQIQLMGGQMIAQGHLIVELKAGVALLRAQIESKGEKPRYTPPVNDIP